MEDNKNGALPILPDQSTPIDANTHIISNQVITQVEPNSQDTIVSLNSKRWKKSDCKVLAIDAKVYSLAVKVYDEQLLYGWSYVCTTILATDKKDFQVLVIRHYRDIYAEDNSPWKSAIEKPHYHLIIRCTDRKKRIRVRTILKQLGIYYRPVLDDILWKYHGVETVGNFEGYATYLTHETEEAIRDGKELYDLSEMVSNLTVEEIKEVREGYLRVGQNEKMTTSKWVELDEIAYKLGKEFGDYDAWYGALPFVTRSGAKMRTVKESYERGVKDAVDEDPYVLRSCIFIRGKHDQGKTFASRVALDMPGRLILSVDGGKSGKLDKLQAYHQAIVVSDEMLPDLLNMADNYKVQSYRRNSGNPYWTGKYLIVTHNHSFEDWVRECGIEVKKADGSYSEQYEAVASRFFICHISDDQRLLMESPATRGTPEEQKERLDLFVKFRDRFNRTIAGYKPGAAFDYDAEIDPECLPADHAIKAHLGFALTRLTKFSDWFWLGKDDMALWKSVKTAKSTLADRTEFLHGLSDADLRNSANNYDRQYLQHFSVAMLRDALEWQTKELDFDDMNIIMNTCD